MQWLINLVVDYIAANRFYVSFDDYPGGFMNLGDFTVDGTWHVADCSSIVPRGTRWIQFTCNAKHPAGNIQARFRRHGLNGTANFVGFRTQWPGRQIKSCLIIPLSEGLTFEYNITAGSWNELSLFPVGYWFDLLTYKTSDGIPLP